jgi:excisionase family DNA binding protein
MADELISLHEAAVRLRCSIRHVARLIEAGRLESVRDADRVERVIETSVVEFELKQQAALERATKPKDELDDPGAAPE